VRRRLEAEFRAEGIPVEQWRILSVLADGNGRSMGELADAVLMNHPTLTKTIDRMISSALVYRVPDPADRRRVLILISDRGRAVARRLANLASSHQASIVESYGDKEALQLKQLLETLIQRTS
jgi:DNA-binding MarR family transcriptional regulator